MNKNSIFGVVIVTILSMKKLFLSSVLVLLFVSVIAQVSVKERIERQRDACVMDALNKGYVEWDRYMDTVIDLNFQAYLEVNREYYFYFIVDPAYKGGKLQVLTHMDKVYQRMGAIIPVIDNNMVQKDLQTPSNGKHYFRYQYKDDVKPEEPIYMCVLIFAKE